MILKRTVVLISVIVVAITLNLDKLLDIDDYVKAMILFSLAIFLSVFEYKRDKIID